MATNPSGLGSVNATGIGNQDKKSNQLGSGVLGQSRPVSVVATGNKAKAGGKKNGGYPGLK